MAGISTTFDQNKSNAQVFSYSIHSDYAGLLFIEPGRMSRLKSAQVNQRMTEANSESKALSKISDPSVSDCLTEMSLRSGIRSAFNTGTFALSNLSKVTIIHPKNKASELQNRTFIVLGASGTMGKDFVARLESFGCKKNIVRSQRSSHPQLLTDSQIKNIPSDSDIIIVNAVGAADNFQGKYQTLQQGLKDASLEPDLIINISLHSPIGPKNTITVTPVKKELGAATVVSGKEEWSEYTELAKECLQIWAQRNLLAIHTINAETGKLNQAISHLCLMGIICVQHLVSDGANNISRMMSVIKEEIAEVICASDKTDSALHLSNIAGEFVDAFSRHLSEITEKDVCKELIEQTKGGLNIVAAKKTLGASQAGKLKEVLSRNSLLDLFIDTHGNWWQGKADLVYRASLTSA